MPSTNNAAAQPRYDSEWLAQDKKKASVDGGPLGPPEFGEDFGVGPVAKRSSEHARRWLDWQCRMISGVQDGGVFLTDPSEGARLQVAACWPNDSADISHLGKVAAEAMLGSAGIIQKRQQDGTGESGINDSLAYPLMVHDQVVGMVALRLAVRSEAQQNAVLQLLQWGILWLETILSEDATARGERGRVLLELVGRSLQSKPLPLLANELCSSIADEFGCSRVAFGRVVGLQVHVLALSHQLRFDRRVARGAELEAAMEECVDQDQPILVSEGAGAGQCLTRAHIELSGRSGGISVCSLPLRDGEQFFGVLTLLGAADEPFDTESVAAFRDAAALIGPILALKFRDNESVWRKLARAARTWTAKLLRPGHLGFKTAIASAFMVLVLLTFIESDHRVSARSTVEGSVRQAIVAPQAGYLATAHARAGDLVEEGFVLATLDDRDLLLEQEKWSSERDKHARERREALAERDRPRAGVLAARMAQADAQLHLIEEQLRRTRLRAPFAGVVVSGDFSRALGVPVERGQTLFELAPLHGYRVALQVDEHHMANLKPGQTGTLRLAGFPDLPLSLTIDRIVPVAVAEAGGNYLRVEAMGVDPPKELRPGMEGVAKVVVGRGSLLWIWTHELLGQLRLWAWNLGF